MLILSKLFAKYALLELFIQKRKGNVNDDTYGQITG